ncbi:CDP-alcohol phosphatidyltransferase family protein [Patescibacteria group bacterium]|nr:CDP-alcohol phosphatidyltransferase family protein [Patescibacteria group bacterium]MBU1673259.1 CDP-alcohol phosphatidyltransferase family protein [Patescibacteria group bacterium]MBU1963520.1 CDP-alcohol phosphatidyltransferase family protein [Patescibacteria group bacterium]
MNLPQKISDVKAYQKPHDSIFSTLFTRRLSRLFTFWLMKLDPRVTPNQVSMLSFMITILAAVFFMMPYYWWRLFGVVLLQVGFALDCSDGEIARIKNMSSKFGAWFDSISDRIKEMLMFAAMTYLWWSETHLTFGIVIGAAAMVLWLMVGYLREAKKSSWPTTRTAEFYITEKIYLGTVDITIYAVSLAVIFNIEIYLLVFIILISIPLIIKQVLSAWRLSKAE